MCVYLSVKFDVSIMILTSFRQRGFFTQPHLPPRSSTQNEHLKILPRLELSSTKITTLFISCFFIKLTFFVPIDHFFQKLESLLQVKKGEGKFPESLNN